MNEGDQAPDFILQDKDGKEVRLQDFRGRNTIVYFYPAASTPGCTKQACDFRDSLASLQGAGYEVLGISPDSAKANYGKTYMGLIRSTIVVDPEGKVTLAQYNVRATGHVAKLRKDLKLDQ